MHRTRSKITAAAFTVVALISGLAGHASATEQPDVAPAPLRVFGQVGLGLWEVANVEVGTFLGKHLALEGMASWNGVYGGRFGGGVFGLVGRARGPRPPRHALLVGARLMLDTAATFDSHGDDLSSYGVIPIGYSFLGDGGFLFRATLGGIIVRQRTISTGPANETIIGHELGIGGPMINVAVGLAWTWQQFRDAF